MGLFKKCASKLEKSYSLYLTVRGHLKISRFLSLGLRVVLLLSLLLILGATLKLPLNARISATKTIDTSPPMEMSKCVDCHKDLNDFQNPNLVNFNHQAHFKKGIRCESCHIEWPHRQSQTIKPTMDLCMNCHRLSHSEQGAIAPYTGCNMCHPAGFNLVPQDHTNDFKKIDHQDEALKSDNQKCLVCHQGEFCRNCHAVQGKSEPIDAYRFYPVWRQPEPRKWPKINIGAEPVKMSDCSFCHTNLQLWKNEKLINFNHPVHFKRGIRCEVCHTEWPHQQGTVAKPVMYECAQCHRLSHSSQGLAASGECNLCHPVDMNLKPAFHTVEFVGGDHKTWARKDRGFCRTCHRQVFCDNCHRLGIDYVPHYIPGWRYEHGIIANSGISITTEGGFACARCHLPEGPKYWYQSAPSCAECHRAVVFPHEQAWAIKHGKTAAAVGGNTCFTCHQQKNFCDQCHRGISMPHAADWLGQHRLYLRDNPVSNCLGCHQKSQCEKCHATHKIHNQKSIYDIGKVVGE